MTSDHPTLSRTEQAGLWWVRLREADVAPEEISQWLDWCQSDPANLEAFENIEKLGGRLSTLDAEARAALTRELLDEPAGTGAAAGIGAGRDHRRRRWLPPLAIAATLVVGVAVWLVERSTPPLQTYSTALGEQQEFKLEDGSQLALGAMSSVSVAYSAAQRRLGLDAGEAYFEVAPNPSRPFVVQVGKLRVTAVGTAFNIRRTGEQIEVAVVHGIVDVREVDAKGDDEDATHKLRLEAGRQVVAGSSGWAVRAADQSQALSWRNGSMAFVDEDLALVVANLNRYAAHPVVLVDAALGQLRYTGTVVQGREDDWVTAIEAVFPVRAARDDQGRVLLSQR
ncbi:MAG: FecR family protein [Hydrocarboniphaga sp.]|uniref:FecR family protein n=1 Tax=Hydrocarboniphaga sp. TaxID=2033016 RepID=UPI00262DAA94|nr:FecR domain-containing protein [Hydrocarboniphaga sp.]MDB5972109.1 FecR family protein [Hydrocarboniphaga sp.]